MKRLAWVLVLLVVLALPAGCRSKAKPIGVPLRDRTRFDAEWSRYVQFEPHKALAVAGDIQGQYVTGFSLGKASRDEAVQSAMDACAQRRTDRRLEDECRLYAVEDEVVAGE